MLKNKNMAKFGLLLTNEYGRADEASSTPYITHRVAKSESVTLLRRGIITEDFLFEKYLNIGIKLLYCNRICRICGL